MVKTSVLDIDVMPDFFFFFFFFFFFLHHSPIFHVPTLVSKICFLWAKSNILITVI